MKIYFTSDLDLKNGKESREKFEDAVFIKEINGKIFCESKDLTLTTSHSLEKVLQVLTDLGYESAILDLDKNKIQEIGEIKTLSNLIEEVKSVGNIEPCGAMGIFIGFVRRLSNDKEVVRLEYEAYEPIFSEKIKEIEERLKDYPGVEGVRIFHKTGVLKPGEDIIYVVIMGRHRKDLWEPLAKSMEIVKKELPIWKKEVYSDGEVWVHDVEISKNDITER